MYMIFLNSIILKPQDILILLKIVTLKEKNWNMMFLSHELYMSQSEISESLKRSYIARLYEKNKKIVFKNALLEFVLHGLKYSFPAILGPEANGIPTAHSAPPLSFCIKSDTIYVWPESFGNFRGQSIKPLYKSVNKAVQQDPYLYELLSLIDAIRIGKAREVNIATEELQKRILG